MVLNELDKKIYENIEYKLAERKSTEEINAKVYKADKTEKNMLEC